MAARFPSKIATQYNNAAAVTPHDSNPNGYAALYVGTGGNIAITTKAGDSVSFLNVPTGTWVQVGTSLVKATGTTAANIIGCW